MVEQHGSGGAKPYSRSVLAGSSRSIHGHSLRYCGTSGLLLAMSLGNIHFPSKPFIYLHCTLNILVHSTAVFDVWHSLCLNREHLLPHTHTHTHTHPAWACLLSFPPFFPGDWSAGGGGETILCWFPEKTK